MKRKIALALIGMMALTTLAGCKSESKEATKEAASPTNTIFTGELEENVTIQVLENDTAISKGYFDELIKAFNKEVKLIGHRV